MKSALVLGGGGFLGSHLTDRLKEEGYWVRCVDVHPPKFASSSADELLLGDLRDLDVCRAALTPEIDEIYQLAANMGGAGFIFTGDNDVDILLDSATINLNVQRVYRGSRARLLFASSACVYPLGAQQDPAHPNCAEEMAYPADPDSEYGWEKLFAERVYGAMDRMGAGVSIARLHNVFGPQGEWRGGREKAPAAICRKVAEAADGDVVQIWGDGRQTRSFLYVDECVEGLRRLMTAQVPGPVNLGSEELISIGALTRMIIEISGKTLDIAFGDGGPEGVRGRCSDNRSIRRQLGWSPSLPLRQGIEKTYAWVEQQVHEATARAAEAAGASAP